MAFRELRTDTSLFIKEACESVTYMLVYVDDIVITRSSSVDIEDVVRKLHTTFSLKDLGPLRYILGIEVKRANSCLMLGQKKFIIELLGKAKMLKATPVHTPMIAGEKLSGNCVFPRGNLVIWNSRNQKIVSRSTIEAEYISVADVAAEVAWVYALFEDMKITQSEVPVIWVPCKLKKAIGSVKDHTSISLAKVVNTNSASLEVVVLKATTHDQSTIHERYVQEVLKTVSSNHLFAGITARSIAKRLGKTKRWVVALKCLMLVLRIVQDGDPFFPKEVLHAMNQKAKSLNLPTLRDGTNSIPYDYTVFVKSFESYLEERLDCFLTGKLQRRVTSKEKQVMNPRSRGALPKGTSWFWHSIKGVAVTNAADVTKNVSTVAGSASFPLKSPSLKLPQLPRIVSTAAKDLSFPEEPDSSTRASRASSMTLEDLTKQEEEEDEYVAEMRASFSIGNFSELLRKQFDEQEVSYNNVAETGSNHSLPVNQDQNVKIDFISFDEWPNLASKASENGANGVSFTNSWLQDDNRINQQDSENGPNGVSFPNSWLREDNRIDQQASQNGSMGNSYINDRLQQQQLQHEQASNNVANGHSCFDDWLKEEKNLDHAFHQPVAFNDNVCFDDWLQGNQITKPAKQTQNSAPTWSNNNGANENWELVLV
ncbi:PAZ domain-containing family protein [Hibiscus syriacus]|uniref:PAZ domain-containing family protein n=1 Tax=Hibiscus syriacus TaxID=106335 RepID=A0A6A3CZZ2_HIBSY|nr:PAZ domain-containing family protein [Hibiscus syriacus]